MAPEAWVRSGPMQNNPQGLISWARRSVKPFVWVLPRVVRATRVRAVELGAVALASSGIALGVVAARFRDRAIDHAARLWALTGSSTPVFWSGLILLYIFSVVLGWLPGQSDGMGDGWQAALIALPWLLVAVELRVWPVRAWQC